MPLRGGVMPLSSHCFPVNSPWTYAVEEMLGLHNQLLWIVLSSIKLSSTFTSHQVSDHHHVFWQRIMQIHSSLVLFAIRFKSSHPPHRKAFVVF